LLFIIVDRVIESGTDSGIETDLNHMMQQAKHEVLEYRHDYGTLPKMIHNPSLRPYISISDLGSNRFVLKGRLGNIKQELIEH
jgi:aryl-phospho-beta-D-glucosidase BglC (GH1 family)